MPVPESPKKSATLPRSLTFAEQCMGRTPSSGSKSFMTVKIDFLISPAYQVPPIRTSRRPGCRTTNVSLRVPSSSGSAVTAGACSTSASGSMLRELLLGRLDEERLREERVPGAVGDDAHGEPVLRVGARERVHDVEIAAVEVGRDLVAQALEVLLRDLLVDVAPPDAALGAGLAHDELVLRRAARVAAGVDDERAALGEPRVALGERVLVEHRGRRLPVDAGARAQPVVVEAEAGLGFQRGRHQRLLSGSRANENITPVGRARPQAYCLRKIRCSRARPAGHPPPPRRRPAGQA